MQGVILDISGVLIVDGAALPGAVAAVARLRAAGLALRFATNTSRKPRAGVLRELRDAGIEAREEEIFTAPRAARQYLNDRALRPLRVIHPELEVDFKDLPDGEENAVLVADAGESFGYAILNRAFRLLIDGAPLVATGVNRYFRDRDGLSLDAGPFVRALEYASGQRAVVTGKPAVTFFESLLKDMGTAAGQTVMLGDDVDSDVAGAIEAGLDGILVQTGKYREGDEQHAPGARLCADVGVAVEALLAGD